MIRTNVFAASALALAVSACGSSSDNTGAADPSLLVEEVPCAQETRATPYSAGMTETAPDGTVVKILSATPAPPILGKQQNGRYNDWTLQVTGPDGGVIDGAKITIDPMMPDHGHYSPVKASVHQNADGTYSASNIDFNMHGFWKVSITVGQVLTTGVHAAVFPLCVE